MKIDEAIRRIENYFASQDTHPRLVNVNNPADAEKLRLHFVAGKTVIKSASDLSQNDENLSDDELFHFINRSTGLLMLSRITSYYKLFGEKKLYDVLSRLQFISRSDLRLVVVCYQCERTLHELDRRFTNYLYYVEGDYIEPPTLEFINPKFPVPKDVILVNGIQNVADAIEKNATPILCIHTNKHKAQYPLSLYSIREKNDAYEVLCELDETTKQLDRSIGTQEDWERASVEMLSCGGWMKYVSDQIAPISNLDAVVSSWETYDNYRKWLCFVGLKLFGAKHNWCFNKAAESSKNPNELIRGVFRSILCLDPDSKEFWERYNQRKLLIKMLGNPDDEVADYCKMVRSKGANALFYLTDASKMETNLIFEVLSQYNQVLGRDKILATLEHVYPALFAYLQPYSYQIPLLDKYFNEYKFQKVFNRISPEFLKLVEEQAEKREYNLLLPERSELLDSIPKNKTAVYFVDAMGVEYLSYIMAECKHRHLFAKVKLAHCELPSLTPFNTSFVNDFINGGAVLFPNKNGIKDLDEIKHHGVEEYDYSNNKLPTHLSRELEIIGSIIEKIATKLQHGFNQAVMISDHGASRLCVIHEHENMWEMSNKGEHSGRCCQKSDIAGIPVCATEDNGFWSLANYDRFKGGRKANVEVHGGATLEEVVVPIIVMTNMPEDIEIVLLKKELWFSRKKSNAVLCLFSKTKLDAITIQITELKVWSSGDASDGQNFSFNIPELKEPGVYHADVYWHGNQIATRLEFKANNTDFQERDIL